MSEQSIPTESLSRRGAPTILFVDDDDESRRLIKTSLKKKGYHVIIADGEEDALEQAGQTAARPDLILIDLWMKPGDVLEAGRRVRRANRLADDAPVVVLSAKNGGTSEGTNVPVGRNDYIVYWEEPRQLDDLLAYLVSNLRA